ncbi:MAG: phosphatase PAP2 family protein, partial [Proteobacteria bacterium]
MDLIDLLHATDLKILKFINSDLARLGNDYVMKIWTAEAPWFLLAGFFLLKTAYRRQWYDLKGLIWMAATVGASDALAAHLIKPFAGRLRPCKVEALVRVVEGCAGSMSFPSNHASNAAAFAVFWWLWQGPRAGVIAVACAVVVG